MKTNRSIKTIVLLLSFLLVSVSFKTAAASIYSRIEKTHIDTGADFIKGYFSTAGQQIEIRGLIIDPDRYRLMVSGHNPENLTGYSLKAHQRRTGAFAAISGGFRSFHGLPLGLVVENGRLLNRIDKESADLTHLLTIKENEVKIIHRDEYDKSVKYDYALQSGPLIVKRGGMNAIDKKEVDNEKPYSRAFIAVQKETGNIVLAITDPVHLYNLAEFLRAPVDDHGLSCDIALNLEGSGNEGFIIRTVVIIDEFEDWYSRRPNAITVKRN